jgi:hypothetical protein
MSEQKGGLHTMQYYSALKRNPGSATTGMSLVDILFSEISQTQDRCCVIPPPCGFRTTRFITTQRGMVASGAGEERNGELFNDHRVCKKSSRECTYHH